MEKTDIDKNIKKVNARKIDYSANGDGTIV